MTDTEQWADRILSQHRNIQQTKRKRTWGQFWSEHQADIIIGALIMIAVIYLIYLAFRYLLQDYKKISINDQTGYSIGIMEDLILHSNDQQMPIMVR
jgi:hypothetical protein